MHTEMDDKDKLIADLQKEVAELKLVIAHQNELITQLRHQLFGSSSEKSSRVRPNTSESSNSSDSTPNRGSAPKKKRAKVAEEESCQRS